MRGEHGSLPVAERHCWCSIPGASSPGMVADPQGLGQVRKRGSRLRGLACRGRIPGGAAAPAGSRCRTHGHERGGHPLHRPTAPPSGALGRDDQPRAGMRGADQTSARVGPCHPTCGMRHTRPSRRAGRIAVDLQRAGRVSRRPGEDAARPSRAAHDRPGSRRDRHRCWSACASPNRRAAGPCCKPILSRSPEPGCSPRIHPILERRHHQLRQRRRRRRGPSRPPGHGWHGRRAATPAVHQRALRVIGGRHHLCSSAGPSPSSHPPSCCA